MPHMIYRISALYTTVRQTIATIIPTANISFLMKVVIAGCFVDVKISPTDLKAVTLIPVRFTSFLK